MKILLIEDEEKLRKIIKLYLEKEGFEVEEVSDGNEAIEKFQPSMYSVVILDVMLPQKDGWSVLREIRKKDDTPVIMLTARGEDDDKIFGFELGADDYVVKPVSPKEIVARVKAILKRTKKPNSNDILFIDKAAREVYVKGQKINLTQKEYELLLYLYERQNIALSREQILNSVWGYEYYGDLRTVDTHIKNLREKLGDLRDYIKTVRGYGYKFEVKK
ncbi:two component transcriptional regulator, winged helix family [Caldicellulosiruptor acetigenus I77R1B]|uniref:Two component transcriptional regulator, winged helix family n=1 Tax=Caldicellulosiruptor acetigenus (strain ATCC 700853 / DSM 12137 / I77R1B) TaxID=632335 RepID=E4S7G6_CALA7|nr:response regulator transcription factor [Caldicellulosiruptor acetigenus]ADQ39811.1 two component transcriptional regulator, winged helix family [Caldicellulosiruptor acetigenus I77R1B]